MQNGQSLNEEDRQPIDKTATTQKAIPLRRDQALTAITIGKSAWIIRWEFPP